ncbi:hypothetical protein DM02DRAFT_632751 [Periconia macrospinosa]|uniref:Uncharacterized protein n=1 Tax=Periconia macrospinosa TaxID=97972 RepID=A0A2V1DBT9_9PLEO|nr:hypothetical protein DM02DRAFT_632751 [Periconia macrospinosa]
MPAFAAASTISQFLEVSCTPPRAKPDEDPEDAGEDPQNTGKDKKNDPPAVDPLAHELRNVRVISTAAVQGRQRPVVIYSSVLANGKDTMALNDPLNFKFIGQKENFNVSVTR